MPLKQEGVALKLVGDAPPKQEEFVLEGKGGYVPTAGESCLTKLEGFANEGKGDVPPQKGGVSLEVQRGCMP